MIREPTFLASAKNYFDSYLRPIDLKSLPVTKPQTFGQLEARHCLSEAYTNLSSVKLRINTKFIKHKFYVIPDLNEPLILGIDFIQEHQFWYCPKNKLFAWEGQPNWGQGYLKVCQATTIPPLSVAYLKATICTEGGSSPGEKDLCIAK